MSCDLLDMIECGKKHLEIEEYIKNKILKPNMKLYDLALKIENEIKKSNNIKDNVNDGIGFPTGLSINNCAAHWTPKKDDLIKLKRDDLIKIDYGVHINGSIIDSAFSYSFDDKYKNLIDCSKNATLMAINMMKPEMCLSEIGEIVEEYMTSCEIILNNKLYKIKPVRDLCGHEIRKYMIHGKKVIPNIKIENYNERVKSGEYYAVETFATTGSGLTYEDNNECSHYMINYNKKQIVKGKNKDFYRLIYENYNTLAFCDRWLFGKEMKKKKEILDGNKIEKKLTELCNIDVINKYPPIYDTIKESYVSQYERSIYINEYGNNILG